MLNKNDTVAIVASSNAKNKKDTQKINELIKIINEWGLKVISSNFLYTSNSEKNIALKKANEINDYFKDENMKIIFDISGGDYANSLLNYLNYECIKKSKCLFLGYSDLTTIINAINKKTGKECYLFNILNIVENLEIQKNLYNFLFNDDKRITNYSYTKIKGDFSSGVVIGGNIRCLLKLAGTKYFPKTKNKILFLESLSGNLARQETYFNQLLQMGVFDDINALILGQFTELDSIDKKLIENLATIYTNKPIFRTHDIGHSKNSKCLIVGKYIKIR